jgi:hypothetical protein
MPKARSIPAIVVWLVVASACTSLSGNSGPVRNPRHPMVALPASLRSPAPRGDCPVGMEIRASSVTSSQLSRQMNGEVPTWVPKGFGLEEAFGREGGSRSSNLQGGALWVSKDCENIEASVYTGPPVAPGWSLEGGAQGQGCFNAVLGKASCWTIQAPGDGQTITVQTMGLTVRQTLHIATSMHPRSPHSELLCPRKLTTEKPKPSKIAGSRAKPVPGEPVALQLCRYRGLSKNSALSLTLTLAATVPDTHRIQELVATLNEFKRLPPKQVVFCPEDSGAADLLRFTYSGTGHLEVIVARSGCRFANNGRSTWWTNRGVWHLIHEIARG